jgi:O-methyltransferase involved in polyketide biosynthesis
LTKLDGTTLAGVSETALFTLWYRASEAARPDSIIDDPQAARLLDSIDYPYRERFGAANQAYAIRALAFDTAIRDFLHEHPGGTVVALAEGLQTSYWRLGRPQCRWITVDLPPIIALREELLPKEKPVVTAAVSALEADWMSLVEPDSPVLITAEGLLAYFDESDARGLIRDCAARFPDGRFVFDSVPQWWARQKGKAFNVRSFFRLQAGTPGYVFPPMPFGISAAEIRAFPDQFSGVQSTQAISPPSGRGLHGRIVQAAYRSALIPDRWRFTVTELRFGTTEHP